MWYGDIFADMANEGQLGGAVYLQEFVEEMLEADGSLPQYGFAADIMNAALREVDWEDLYDHYAVEDEKEDA